MRCSPTGFAGRSHVWDTTCLISTGRRALGPRPTSAAPKISTRRRRATGQDDTMPDGLAQAAYDVIHGRFTDDQRKGVFKPEVPVGGDATPQQRLLAYTGRSPG